MGLRAIRSLQPVVDRIVVAGRRDLPDSWHAHPVFGEREGSGPLGAILDASEHSPARRVVVVPCDMPNLTSAAIDKLIEGCDIETLTAAFATSTSLDKPQWLAGCWNGERLRDEIGEMFVGGITSIRHVASLVPHVLIDLPVGELLNINSLVDQ